MKPIISYSGGKSRQAAWICGHFPEHSLYLEPFFGMGSVFFYKPPSKAEIINDLESIIYNFWTVIKDKTKSMKLCKEAKCKIVISGYESDLYPTALKDWRHETQEAQTRMHTPHTEHIWLNY